MGESDAEKKTVSAASLGGAGQKMGTVLYGLPFSPSPSQCYRGHEEGEHRPESHQD